MGCEAYTAVLKVELGGRCIHSPKLPGHKPQRVYESIWGFPNIRGTFLGVTMIRTRVFGGLSWGAPILGNYHIM